MFADKDTGIVIMDHLNLIKDCDPTNEEKKKKIDGVTKELERFARENIKSTPAKYEDLKMVAEHFFILGEKTMRDRIANPEYNKEYIEKMLSEYPEVIHLKD